MTIDPATEPLSEGRGESRQCVTYISEQRILRAQSAPAKTQLQDLQGIRQIPRQEGRRESDEAGTLVPPPMSQTGRPRTKETSVSGVLVLGAEDFVRNDDVRALHPSGPPSMTRTADK